MTTSSRGYHHPIKQIHQRGKIQFPVFGFEFADISHQPLARVIGMKVMLQRRIGVGGVMGRKVRRWLSPPRWQLPVITDEDEVFWAVLVFAFIGAVHAFPALDRLKVFFGHDFTDEFFIGSQPLAA
ncbi:hypothetical protein B843_06540 [Corynebacterium vitaeruminis DSM 20294]|uniref:Uncharacterized protein n=1 Tax=Corynebacterium vitaeruminis DSM 20294 TaxID=1224164 RepID=W5Y851_9CORY|nr:hypothetical protein B843_06540 [Corynebacterium vitaeruminis DSM 20294]